MIELSMQNEVKKPSKKTMCAMLEIPQQLKFKL